MVLSTTVRRQKLDELRKSTPEGKQKLFYKGRPENFDVHRINLDWLIYNEHNGRIEAEMLTWKQEHQISAEYSTEKHHFIEGLLWNLSVSRNKATLEDLKKKSQQRPGIVSLDGVIIDGNRRAMLLRRMEQDSKPQYFDAIILPDAYADNETEIVRLETQYQLGEDSKVEYGSIQKYLHARRLNADLNIPETEIDALMGREHGYAERLLGIMDLMDGYLEHIGCPRLYTMLKDTDGTKEGMFVDLFNDLKRLEGKNPRVEWIFDEIIDVLRLKTIQFDYIRLGDFADAKKSYRALSHQSKGKNFFGHEEIWKSFAKEHTRTIDPINTGMDSLEEYIAKNPGYSSKTDAAKARDEDWSAMVSSHMKKNFGTSGDKLYYKIEELKPKELLEKAKLALDGIEIEGDALVADLANEGIVRALNQMTYEMKKRFERI
eukprot:TRINITY_DN20073_c0_g1_i1.p3 TRINITY_DN20073_c0_g1~~TRINITY_DN20073_c0_g1_i1.p3  ORF type:complete len:432 (+),score=57.73 TRINITY_DN20073_c0_g1_i1:978-2273(+)